MALLLKVMNELMEIKATVSKIETKMALLNEYKDDEKKSKVIKFKTKLLTLRIVFLRG